MMSDSPSEPSRKKKDRKGANLNLKRPADQRVNEEDLWNFDEEPAPAKDALMEQPAETVVETRPEPVAETPDAPVEEEPITRIEPSYSKRRLRRNQRRQAHQDNEEADVFEELDTALPAREEPLAPSKEISPSTPVGLGLNEDELWGDFLEEEDIAAPAPPPPAPVNEATEVVAEIPLVSPPAAPEMVEEDVISSAEEDAVAEEVSGMDAEMSPSLPAVEMFDEPSSEGAEGTADEVSATAASKVEFSWKSLQFTRLEMITSAVLLSLLLVIGLWALSAFRSQVLAQVNPYELPDYPIRGSLAKVQSAETYWRAPIREGDGADVVRREITLIPVIEVTLDEGASPNGVIRVMFYNDKGEIAGDTITRSFQNHQFTGSGSNRMAFSGTTGFTDFGEQEAYRAQLVKPWSIRVFEGPDDNAPSSAFKLLFSTPISTNIE
jgi:hypothetical protein